MRPPAILFDNDGTLMTTGGAGAVAWRRAFEELLPQLADEGYLLGITTGGTDSAAHGARAIGVGVASGHFSEEALERAGEDYVLPSLRSPLPVANTTSAA